MIKEIRDLFKGSGIKVTTDKEESHFNFSTKDGTNCEFHECNGSGYLTATYEVGGVERELDLHYQDDSDELVSVVKDILEVEKKPKLKLVKEYPRLRLVT